MAGRPRRRARRRNARKNRARRNAKPTYEELMERARKYQVRLSPSGEPTAPASVAPRSTPAPAPSSATPGVYRPDSAEEKVRWSEQIAKEAGALLTGMGLYTTVGSEKLGNVQDWSPDQWKNRPVRGTVKFLFSPAKLAYVQGPNLHGDDCPDYPIPVKHIGGADVWISGKLWFSSSTKRQLKVEINMRAGAQRPFPPGAWGTLTEAYGMDGGRKALHRVNQSLQTRQKTAGVECSWRRNVICTRERWGALHGSYGGPHEYALAEHGDDTTILRRRLLLFCQQVEHAVSVSALSPLVKELDQLYLGITAAVAEAKKGTTGAVPVGLTEIGKNSDSHEFDSGDHMEDEVIEFQVDLKGAASSPLYLLIYTKSAGGGMGGGTVNLVLLTDKGKPIGMALFGYSGEGHPYLADLVPRVSQDTESGLAVLAGLRKSDWRVGDLRGYDNRFAPRHLSGILHWVSEALAGKWPVVATGDANRAVRLAAGAPDGR